MRSEGELRELLQQADELPYGAAQIALVEQVVAEADAQQLTDLMFEARMEATSAYRFGGESARAVVTFSWCLAEYDRDPMRYAGHQWLLLWQLKSTVGALTLFPEVPLERVYGLLDDMERRWRDNGNSMHAVYALRHRVARHIGAVDQAEELYHRWCAAPRDDLSNCAGCDPSAKASWLARQGRDEEAVALLEPVLAGERTCRAQPQDILTTLLFPYLRTGRLDQARDAHRRAYRLHRPLLADLSDIADHLEFCARTGNAARGVEILERHLGWLDKAPSPLAAMAFAGAGALVLRHAAAGGAGVRLQRPAHDGRPAADVSGEALGAELGALALDIAGRFDARNGTDHQSTKMRSIMDGEPLVAGLPLAPARPAASGPAVTPPPPTVAMTVADASGRANVRRGLGAEAVFAKYPAADDRPGSSTVDEPVDLGGSVDELLDAVGRLREEDRPERIADVLDELARRTELATHQRARYEDERALLRAEAGDLAEAERRWRIAEGLYAEAGQAGAGAGQAEPGQAEAEAGAGQAGGGAAESPAERVAVVRARLGLLLCQTDRVEPGLALLIPATEELRASPSAEIRSDAVLRLCRALLDTGRAEEALSLLDGAGADFAEAPVGNRAAEAVQRLLLLLRLDRLDELGERAAAALDLVRAARSRRLTVLANLAIAKWRQELDDPAGAGDHLTRAIDAEYEPRQQRVLRMMRAEVLAPTDQARLVFDDLVDAVAEFTAEGREADAADARYWLALCYSRMDRVLDAAEVAEEELAYRLRRDAAGLDEHTPSHGTRVRYLLGSLYERLEQYDEGLAQLDAIIADHLRAGQPTVVARMNEEAADLLDRLDRDDAAAGRYLIAAEGFAGLGQRVDELRTRRRHALSLHWAHGFERALPAVEAVDGLAAAAVDEPGLGWERAMLDYDAARILWAAGRLGDAATRASAAAEAFLGFDQTPEASAAHRLLANVLLTDGQAGPAEAAIRLALSEMPPGLPRERSVEILDAALRAQGRDGAADQCWGEYGLPSP